MPPRKKKTPALPKDEPVAPPALIEPPPAPETAAARAAPAHDAAEGARARQPDPFTLMTVSLGPDRDSPKMRLYRSNRMNQMAIGFDDKPEQQHRVRLREDGWRWRETEGVWTKQLDRERRASGQLEAERLFTEISEAIRGDLGLEPQRGVGS